MIVKISIVTPVYNSSRYIRKTIESVLSQKGDFELEYIIKDGGSTDGTLEIISEYKNRLTLISSIDHSIPEAINIGMNIATGDIGGILMGDDTYDDGALQAVVIAFRNNPKPQWLYGRCRVINEYGSEIWQPITIYKNVLGYFYSKHILLCEQFISEPATFWKMNLWREIGGWSSIYKRSDDYHMWLKMAQKSPALPVRKNLSSFRRHSTSISNNFFEEQMIEEISIAKEYGTMVHLFIHTILLSIRKKIYKFLSKN